jgi:hypothetical protein
MPMLIRTPALTCALAPAFAAACLASAALAVEAPPAPPPCETIGVVLVDSVDSARAKAGDAFRFRTAADTPATANHPAVPAGTVGYGLVMGAHHSQRGGRPGHLIVDARFLVLADGTRIPATLIPRSRFDAPVMDGAPADAPGYIGFIPFASVMTGAYNTLHYGREVVFASGTPFKVLIGDELAFGKCRLTVDDVHPGASGAGTPAPQPSTGSPHAASSASPGASGAVPAVSPAL